MFNQAVVYVQLRQWNRALDVLESLYAVFNQLDTNVAVSVCFLLLDVYIAQNETEKAAQVLEAAEKKFASELTNDNSSSDSSRGFDDDMEELSGGLLYAKTLSSAPGEPPVWNGTFQNLLCVYRAKVHLLNKNLKMTRREIKNSLSGSSQNPTTIFLKANLEFLRFNHRKSIKLLAQCQHLHSVASQEETGMVDLGGVSRLDNELLNLSVPAYYYNNIGCVQFHQGKFSAAAAYFAKAFAENDHVYSSRIMPSAGRAKSLPSFSKDRKPHILYNCGLQLLLTGKPESAFRCFSQGCVELYTNPKLWLRMAEACIASHNRMTSGKLENYQGDLVVSVHSAENNKGHIKLNSNHDNPKDLFFKQDDDLGSSKNIWNSDESVDGGSKPVISLSYAIKCLRNGLRLLDLADANSSNDGENGPNTTFGSDDGEPNGLNGSGTNSSLQPSSLSGGRTSSRNAIRVKMYMNLAYACLCIDSAVEALRAANSALEILEVMKQTESTQGRQGDKMTQDSFQSHMYAAEACFKLDRMSEAVEHLIPSNMLSESSLNIGNSFAYYNSPFVSERHCQPNTEEARASLFVNMACVYIGQGDFNSALKSVTAAHLAYPQSTHTRLLMVYLEMKAGNRQSALEVLKRR
eukprot:TRINITY_DN463_c0_g1_i2.p1 TRINITY_DN463_c0_g1~~TRINITY_DN463_c0_g1_i2.p1  ORF type:complete len:633 (+),score=164.03 TRINITY_DN463_c0_g1_i2:476-2374(+)